MKLAVVILAAGQGVRMRSSLPKVLHPIGGTPILEHIIHTAEELNPDRIVIVLGAKSDKIKEALQKTRQNTKIEFLFAEQKEQLGTGHAVLQALPQVASADQILILYGDVPLIAAETLKKLIACSSSAEESQNSIGFVSIEAKNPFGLGRVQRNDQGKVLGIIEEKDATPKQREIREIYAGIFLAPTERMKQWLPSLKNQNSQKEYYLTEIVKFALAENLPIHTASPKYHFEVLGVNDKMQLAELERIFQRNQANLLMQKGVTLADPNRFDVRGELLVGEDVSIDVNAIFEGRVKLGNQVSIGPNVFIKNAEIHDGVQILANSVIEGAVIAAGCSVGPFARIRPGTELGVNARIGNFVEVKNSRVGGKSKINHLSYIGDTLMGEEVNVGAGTITCNYDGKYKHQTIIGNHVSIGSDTQLIAPVRVGDGATIGAGTTVVRDILPKELVHNRVTHRSVINWSGREDDDSKDSDPLDIAKQM